MACAAMSWKGPGLALLLTGLSVLPWLFTLPGLADVWTPSAWRLLLSSGLLALGVAAAALAAGVVLAGVLLLGRRGRLAVLLGVLLGAGFLLSPVVALSAWKAYGLDRVFSPWASSVLVLAGHYCPLALAVTLLGLSSLERSAVESGLIAASPFAVARFIVAPQMFRLWALAGFVLFWAAFSETETPSLLRYPVYGEEILARLSIDDSPARAAGLAWMPALLTLLAAPFLWRWAKPVLGQRRMGGMALGMDIQASLRQWGNRLLAVLTGLFALPLLALCAKSGANGFWGGLPSVGQSLGLGSLSALAATAAGHLVNEGLARSPSGLRPLVLAAFAVQAILPAALLGLGMAELGRWPLLEGFSRGDGWLVVTHALRVLPWLVLLLAGLRAQSGVDNEESSRLMPLSWLARQRFLVMPRLWPALLCAFALGLGLSLSELATTILVVAPGTETAVLRLYNLIHYGDWASVAALALLLAAAGLGVCALAWGLLWRRYAQA